MNECAVTPTPDNFELFYQYATGTDPNVAHVMGEMISKRKPFTQDVLDRLRSQCLPSAKAQQAIATMSDGMSSVLDSVLDKIGAAGRDALAYGQTLSAASGEFA